MKPPGAGVPKLPPFFIHRSPAEGHFSEDAMGGWQKEGLENLTNDTPPKKGFWTPPSYGTFSTPLNCQCSVFPVQKSTTEQARSSFGGAKNFRESAFSGTFSFPIRFAPPHITAQICRGRGWGCMSFGAPRTLAVKVTVRKLSGKSSPRMPLPAPLGGVSKSDDALWAVPFCESPIFVQYLWSEELQNEFSPNFFEFSSRILHRTLLPPFFGFFVHCRRRNHESSLKSRQSSSTPSLFVSVGQCHCKEDSV